MQQSAVHWVNIYSFAFFFILLLLLTQLELIINLLKGGVSFNPNQVLQQFEVKVVVSIYLNSMPERSFFKWFVFNKFLESLYGCVGYQLGHLECVFVTLSNHFIFRFLILLFVCFALFCHFDSNLITKIHLKLNKMVFVWQGCVREMT